MDLNNKCTWHYAFYMCNVQTNIFAEIDLRAHTLAAFLSSEYVYGPSST